MRKETEVCKETGSLPIAGKVARLLAGGRICPRRPGRSAHQLFLRVQEQVVTLFDAQSRSFVREPSVCSDRHGHCHRLPRGTRNLDLPLSSGARESCRKTKE